MSQKCDSLQVVVPHALADFLPHIGTLARYLQGILGRCGTVPHRIGGGRTVYLKPYGPVDDKIVVLLPYCETGTVSCGEIEVESVTLMPVSDYAPVVYYHGSMTDGQSVCGSFSSVQGMVAGVISPRTAY